MGPPRLLTRRTLLDLPGVQVRTVPVKTRRIPLSALNVRPPRQEEVSSVEASLRLDAIASAGAAQGLPLGSTAVHWRAAA